MAVENRTAESHMGLGIAIAAKGEVAAGHHELELPIGFAEQGDALLLAPGTAIGVILELLHELRIPLGIDQRLEDVVDQSLLLFGIKVGNDMGLGDLPVVAHEGSKEAPVLVDMVPGEGDLPALLRGEGLEQFHHGALGIG